MASFLGIAAPKRQQLVFDQQAQTKKRVDAKIVSLLLGIRPFATSFNDPRIREAILSMSSRLGDRPLKLKLFQLYGVDLPEFSSSLKTRLADPSLTRVATILKTFLDKMSPYLEMGKKDRKMNNLVFLYLQANNQFLQKINTQTKLNPKHIRAADDIMTKIQLEFLS